MWAFVIKGIFFIYKAAHPKSVAATLLLLLCWKTISRLFYCIFTAEPILKKLSNNKSQPVLRKGRHFLSWPRPRALHAMETDRRRMLFSGPVSARCHGSRGDRADVIRMGVPWLPWRQSVRAVRMLGLPHYTKTERTPYKTSSPARLQNGECDNNDTP